MNQKIKFERRFLLTDLPAPLTRASEHLQFFDNYLTGTRLLLRQIRTPKTKQWQRKFVQKYAIQPPDLSCFAFSEIELSEYEYEILSVFEGNELRYNRYFLKLETGETMFVDMFLNRQLWNLILAAIEFETEEAMKKFVAPPFLIKEITNEPLFSPAKLADATIENSQQLTASSQQKVVISD